MCGQYRTSSRNYPVQNRGERGVAAYLWIQLKIVRTYKRGPSCTLFNYFQPLRSTQYLLEPDVSHPMPIIKPLFALSSLLQLVISGDFWPRSPPGLDTKKTQKIGLFLGNPLSTMQRTLLKPVTMKIFGSIPHIKRVSVILTMLV